MGNQGIPPGLMRVIWLSAAIHMAILLGFAVSSSAKSSVRPTTLNVLTTKLVRLGKKRPEKLLPRIPTAPPPSSKAVPIKAKTPAKAATPSKRSAPVASAKDRIAQLSRLSNALSRVGEHASEVEGDPEGDPQGEVTSLKDAIMGNRYLTALRNCVRSHYNIEGVDPSRLQNLTAQVFVKVDADGALHEHKLLKGSGNKHFDRAVLRATKRCNKVEPPPTHMKKQLHTDGVEFEFTSDAM
jgi:TonB family protein